ncbi:MAG: hypothetical protein KTR33_05785 [Gammaproteobacteria bacterium]|nr:hypothetical protein [Gammaproteobacteria bacterium]
MTKLLKANDAPLSTVKANKLLLGLGILEERERESSTRPGLMKKYKALTEAGEQYGFNQENPQSPGQTSPYYYRDSFADLLKLLLEAADQAAESQSPK